MREILFRGKQIDNGEWVEGYYLHQRESMTDSETHYIVQNHGFGFSYNAVHPDTVGQYTGLTDKNGKKIFEGDIVRHNTCDDFDCYSVVKFGEYEQDGSGGEYKPRDCIGWYAEVDNFTFPDWAEDVPIYFKDCWKQQNLLEVSAECEIIGNIHDNPELLED